MNEQTKPRKGPDLTGMITKEEALSKLFGAWSFTPESEEIQISDSLGRTLAKDYVRADTGDDFDDAFDSVIEIEKVTMLEGGGIKLSDVTDVTPGNNVSPKGSNIQAGTQVGRAGSQITPLTIAALILAGFSEVEVWKKPVIAFIPTGSELVSPGSELKRGQNFDSNSLMVQAMLTRLGADVILHPIIKDDLQQIAQALDDTLPSADFVILNAGTSKGGEDYCVQYLEKHGNMLFHGVKAVPGRPMSITILNGKPVINMSGPAVGAYYGCLWLIPKILDHMLNHSEPISFAQAEATLTERMNVPSFFEALSAIELTTDADGNLLATPCPRSKGRSAGLMSDAHYINRIGEHPKDAGEKIQVILNR